MPAVDRISNMPDHILQLILSGLPTTEEVARTSILSSKWRYIWTIIPSIDIDCSRAQDFDYIKFEKFVTWVLKANNNTHCDLDSFRLHCSSYYTLSTVVQWIDAAVKRNVKSLDLVFNPRNQNAVFGLPNCDSLRTLKLCLFGSSLLSPYNVKFPSLKVLELKNVCCFEYALVEQFLRMCPLLEDLSFLGYSYRKHDTLVVRDPKLKKLRIGNLHNVMRVTVTCPELVLLEYAGPCGRFFIEGKLDSLKKAVFVFHDPPPQEILFLPNVDALCFFGIAHVESLSLNFRFIQCIAAATYPNGYFPVPLPNLKTFELTANIDDFTMEVLIWILRCSPVMESLHLIIQKERSSPDNWCLYEAERRSILTRCLKRVKFLEFRGERGKVDIARIFLEHGYSLEEMVFSWNNEVKYQKSKKTMNAVSKFYQASSTVKLISLKAGDL